MNWQSFWDKMARNSKNQHQQVGRISSRMPINDIITQNIIKHITQVLQLYPGDSLLDVCCGNGFLAHQLAKRCRRVVGIDISHAQIHLALHDHNAVNTTYYQGDALELSKLIPQTFDKILLYFSFQYFESVEAGSQVVGEMAKLLHPKGRILIGDVPDSQYFFKYYNTPKRYLSYLYKKARKKNDMGKFWKTKEMEAIAKEHGLKLSILPQPKHLPFSYYRTDYLLQK